jgi:hypothetical protein
VTRGCLPLGVKTFFKGRNERHLQRSLCLLLCVCVCVCGCVRVCVCVCVTIALSPLSNTWSGLCWTHWPWKSHTHTHTHTPRSAYTHTYTHTHTQVMEEHWDDCNMQEHWEEHFEGNMYATCRFCHKYRKNNIYGIWKLRPGRGHPDDVLQQMQRALMPYLESVIRDAVTYCEHCYDKTVTAQDIGMALDHRERQLSRYGHYGGHTRRDEKIRYDHCGACAVGIDQEFETDIETDHYSSRRYAFLFPSLVPTLPSPPTPPVPLVFHTHRHTHTRTHAHTHTHHTTPHHTTPHRHTETTPHMHTHEAVDQFFKAEAKKKKKWGSLKRNMRC